MPRKKSPKRMQKRKTRTMSRKLTAKNPLVDIKKQESQFLQFPKKLSASLEKTITGLKKKQTKLKAALAKASNQVETSERKFHDASENRETVAARKKYSKMKKLHSGHVKNHTMLSKQLSALTKDLDYYNSQHARYTELKKYLGQFDKDWAKNSKNPSAKVRSTSDRDTQEARSQRLNNDETIEDMEDELKQSDRKNYEFDETISNTEEEELTS